MKYLSIKNYLINLSLVEDYQFVKDWDLTGNGDIVEAALIITYSSGRILTLRISQSDWDIIKYSLADYNIII